jgi:hypothetical protein
LWGKLKEKVYLKNLPRWKNFRKITGKKSPLFPYSLETFSQCEACLEAEGHYFKTLLKNKESETTDKKQALNFQLSQQVYVKRVPCQLWEPV